MLLTLSTILTHGELFAGISGFGLGFSRAGIETLWYVEIDKSCQDILRRHYPSALIFSDVRDCGIQNLMPVDIISFGSPCQDLSVAGRRGGLDGKRSGLFFEAIRITNELKPTFAVWENVPGSYSSNSGRDFAAVLAAFRDIGARDIAWTCLDAQYFGVAQRRRRVFLVADFRGERAAEVFFERTSSAWDPPPSREAGAKPAYALAASVRGSGDGHGQGWNSNYVMAWALRTGHTQANENNRWWREHTQPIDTSGSVAVAYAVSTRSGERLSTEDNYVVAVSENQHAELRLTEYSRQLTSGGGKPGQGYPCVLAFQGKASTAQSMNPSDVAPTLDQAKAGGMSVSGAFGVRRLTPVECARLQSFPDDWLAGQSDSKCYKQLGNAVCVNVSAWIGQRIMKVIHESK